jgi:hypothetical protein
MLKEDKWDFPETEALAQRAGKILSCYQSLIDNGTEFCFQNPGSINAWDQSLEAVTSRELPCTA